MAASKTLRSGRSMQAGTTPSPTSSKTSRNAKVSAGRTTRKTKTNTTDANSTDGQDGEQTDSDGSSDANDSEEAAEKDDSNEVPAPSSEISTTQLPEAEASDAIATTAWTGHDESTHNETSNELGDVVMSDPVTKSSDIVEDMTNYEFSDSESLASDQSAIGIDFNDEDDYDEVDNISNTSDDSLAFEKEVERDIQEEGEAIFDWQNEETYEYDETWNTGIYDIGHDGLMEPMADFDLTKRFTDARMTQSAPALLSHDHDALDSYQFSWTAANSMSSSSSIDTPPSSPSTAPAHALTPTDDGEETEDDEVDHTSTIHSPGLKLTRSNEGKYGRESRRVPGPPARTNDPKCLPTPRRVRIDPKRAVAFTANGPLGRSVRYITPKGRAYKLVDLRSTSASSIANSVPSSPTMINLDEAILHGNTRTGAHITDVVHGAIFRYTHCPQSPSSHEPPRMSSFYQSFLLGPSGPGIVMEGDGPLFEDELIDFEQCDEPSTSTTPCHTLESPAPQTITNIPSITTTDVDMMPPPATPSPAQYQTPTVDSTSPRKRRFGPADLDIDIEMTPLAKKTRMANQVTV